MQRGALYYRRKDDFTENAKRGVWQLRRRPGYPGPTGVLRWGQGPHMPGVKAPFRRPEFSSFSKPAYKQVSAYGQRVVPDRMVISNMTTQRHPPIAGARPRHARHRPLDLSRYAFKSRPYLMLRVTDISRGPSTSSRRV